MDVYAVVEPHSIGEWGITLETVVSLHTEQYAAVQAARESDNYKLFVKRMWLND